MDTVKERLEYLLSTLYSTKTAAAEALGWTRSYISNVTTGKDTPSFEFLKRLAAASEMVNMDWLFHGRGPMIFEEYPLSSDGTKVLSLDIVRQNPEPRAAAEDAAPYLPCAAELRLIAKVEEMRKEIDALRKEVAAQGKKSGGG